MLGWSSNAFSHPYKFYLNLLVIHRFSYCYNSVNQLTTCRVDVAVWNANGLVHETRTVIRIVPRSLVVVSILVMKRATTLLHSEDHLHGAGVLSVTCIRFKVIPTFKLVWRIATSRRNSASYSEDSLTHSECTTKLDERFFGSSPNADKHCSFELF